MSKRSCSSLGAAIRASRGRTLSYCNTQRSTAGLRLGLRAAWHSEQGRRVMGDVVTVTSSPSTAPAALSVVLSAQQARGARARHSAPRCREADLEWDSDILPFVGVASESEALPVGEERELWSAAALDGLQPQISEAEGW